MNGAHGFCAQCGKPIVDGAAFCAGCGRAVGSRGEAGDGAASTAPPALPPPTLTPPVAGQAGAHPAYLAEPASPKRPVRWVVVGVAGAAVLALLVALVVVLSNRGDESTSSPAAGAATTAAAAGEVLLEPVGTPGPDPFSPSVSTAGDTPVTVSLPPLPAATEPVTSDPATGPTATTGAGPAASGTAQPTKVLVLAGDRVGLYGGTTDVTSCDAAQLVTYLGQHADKAAAWAKVQGIPATDIGHMVNLLTPVRLTRDTRVTNHGFTSGRATPRQSVLQAGTAVLVDPTGLPRVKCACGNPLLAPVPVPAAPKYTGTAWSAFDPAALTSVRPAATEQASFVLVDLGGGDPFRRGAGAAGTDVRLGADERCRLFPEASACLAAASTTSTRPPTTTTPATTAPANREEVVLFAIDSKLAVQEGPTAPSLFTADRPFRLTKLMTYHWNAAQGAPPGTIGLRNVATSAVYGPWPATGSPGQGGVPNAYWTAVAGVDLPAGTYEIVDSNPATWAQNAETGGRGMGYVYGFWTAPPPPPAPTPAPTAPRTTTPRTTAPLSGEAAAVQRVAGLLAACGQDVLEVVGLGAGDVAGSWVVEARLASGGARYLVLPGNDGISPMDQQAADLAVACGFYQP